MKATPSVKAISRMKTNPSMKAKSRMKGNSRKKVNSSKKAKSSNDSIKAQGILYLYKVPLDVWEMVFDRLGPSLRPFQLTCRLFRVLAVQRLWRNVCISLSGETTASCSTWISRHNIRFAGQVLPSVASHIKKLTIELKTSCQKDYGIIYRLSSHGVDAIEVAMTSAEEIYLIVDGAFFDTQFDPVRHKLRKNLSSLSAKKTLAVAIDTEIMGYRDSMKLINWFESIGAASIEVDTVTRGFRDIRTANYARGNTLGELGLILVSG
ncbi:hypothetical protein TRVA0_021S01288 [Trichomonascus vanleenenianus]|uniref:uncharacterized protein n=1 Tax=Trichomonascus vanleenenianus TaxID=2268995 RepID=UPI003ECB1C22